MQLGILVRRAANLDSTWTTLHLAQAALDRGHDVRFMEPGDIEVDDRRQLVARTFGFESAGGITVERMVRALRKREAPRRYLRLDALDVLLMRCAPFDPTIAALGLMAADAGVEVVNDPRGMLRVQHKAWLASLPGVPIPRTLVTRSLAQAQVFFDKHRKPVVVKPARGSGGRAVHFVRRRDPVGFDRAFRAASEALGSDRHVVVQTYLPEAEAGEKRLVWMDGTLLGGYLRTRAPGEFRHNLKQGGEAVRTTISASDERVSEALSPHLIAAGIRLAGLDLIGEHLVEVNTVNPGGSYHADRLHGTDVSGRIIEGLMGTPLRRTLQGPA